jgi:hypothetical protein
VKPDVIVCWPRNCDYPLWRQFIADERDRFARVLVVFTEHDGPDYTGFVTDAMGPGIECFWSPPRGNRDWRDVAVNAALDRSDAEWVWFTEQDFLITQPGAFFWRVNFLGQFAHVDAMGWREIPRWHPSCLFVRRSAIEQTDRYFGPEPIDHFFGFGAQLAPYDLVQRGGLGGAFEHLQGVSQNDWLRHEAGTLDTPGIFNRERFAQYLADCLEVTVPLHPLWRLGAQLHAAGT